MQFIIIGSYYVSLWLILIHPSKSHMLEPKYTRIRPSAVVKHSGSRPYKLLSVVCYHGSGLKSLVQGLSISHMC